MGQPGRKFSSGSRYRYGFNGKENDNEVKGEGNQQDYGMRIYDPRLGRFLSEDPITREYPELTPYQFASNSPIESIDLDGLESLSSIKSGLYKKFQAEIRVASTPPPEKEKEITMRDVNGVPRTGAKSEIEATTARYNKEYHDANLASAIASGVPGSAGYLIGGEEGAYVGQAIGNLNMSATGIIPARSSVLSKPQIESNPFTINYTTTYEHPPLNLSINLKPTWNKAQITAAYNKAQAITNNPEAKVTIKNPAPRPSNLKNSYLKQGGTVTKDQHVDHITDLQINGTNKMSNLGGLNGSVNSSYGKQLNLQIQHIPDNTRVNTVSINPFTGKRN